MSDKLLSLYQARLAREKGTVRKDWGGRISVALVYPNAYRIGMSNLGFQVVYSLLNRREDVVAERVFLPEGKEMSLCAEAGKGLLSMESLSALQRFDLIAFSLSFENDYPNILKILSLGKIPYLSEDREEFHPFVMAGGITTFLNPEPLAPFFDFFLLGEAEATLEEFLVAFREVRTHCVKRREALKVLAASVTSFYVPSLYRIDYHKDGTIQTREPLDPSAPEKIEVLRPSLAEMPVRTSYPAHGRVGICRPRAHRTRKGLHTVLPVLCRGIRLSASQSPRQIVASQDSERGPEEGTVRRPSERVRLRYPGHRGDHGSHPQGGRPFLRVFATGGFPDSKPCRTPTGCGAEDRRHCSGSRV